MLSGGTARPQAASASPRAPTLGLGCARASVWLTLVPQLDGQQEPLALG